jgi:hypothetical protein
MGTPQRHQLAVKSPGNRPMQQLPATVRAGYATIRLNEARDLDRDILRLFPLVQSPPLGSG